MYLILNILGFRNLMTVLLKFKVNPDKQPLLIIFHTHTTTIPLPRYDWFEAPVLPSSENMTR